MGFWDGKRREGFRGLLKAETEDREGRCMGFWNRWEGGSENMYQIIYLMNGFFILKIERRRGGSE